jgi:NAD+ diphosphatase
MLPTSPKRAFITHTFAGSPLNRASDRRPDAAWLAGKLDEPRTRVLVMWNGAPLLKDGALVWLGGNLAKQLAVSEERLLFLGLDRDLDGSEDTADAVFALDLEGVADPAEGPLEGFGLFGDLRTAAAGLPVPETGMLSTARSLFEWRRRHRFCSVCGQPSNAVDGGWKRICPSCGAQHFPRVDPCVIMLPIFGDRCLLGRQAAWAKGRFSALAGFLEPGESIEEACAREVKEEAGLTVTSVRYHSSQPWPYPSNLMIGLMAEVSDDQAAPDLTELEEVRWLTKAQTRDLLDGKVEGLSAPPPMAIAHCLIRDWAFS